MVITKIFKNTLSFLVTFSLAVFTYAQDGVWPGSNMGTLSCPSTTTVSGNTSGASEDCIVSSAGDHIYQFTISSTVDVTIDLCSSSYDTQIHLFNLANGDCDAGAISSNDDGGSCSGLQSYISEGCLSAGDYVIVIEGYSSNEGAYSMDITTSNCSSCPSTGTGADTPWPGLSLGNIACGASTSVSDNTSGMNQDCGVSSAGDHIYEFTLTSPYTDITLDVCGASWDTQIHLFSLSNGDCNSGAIASNDDNCGAQSSITETCLSSGTYVIVVEGFSSNEGAYTLNINTSCSSCTPPPNDDCSGAYSTLVNTNGTCSSTSSGTIEDATGSVQSSSACSGTEDDDVWFSFTAPSTGAVDIDLLNISGSTSDLYHSVWSGACPTLSLVSGSCSDPNSSTIIGLTPGQTYYIRVYSWTSTSGQNSTFDICLQEADPCGNPPNNDYCSDPAILTQGGSSWSSSTNSTYTSDSPANTGGVFCGSIENNSWYMFTAQSTTETFNFTTVNNCRTGNGIQAEVYEVATNANGCCTALSSMSNCWNPTTATSGTVTATGLTVGNDYYLMVDGYAGDNCDFTVSGWEATGVLPVQLISFDGINEKNKNVLHWKTASEKNNDYFIIQHSTDGINWSTIETIKGAGTVSDEENYSLIHRGFKKSINYYSLQQVDYDGTVEDHGVVAINNIIDKKILKRINLMGQEVDENYRGVVLIYFDDGSIEKIIQ